MELLHVVHRLGLVAAEAEDLCGDEDVSAARLDRVRKDQLLAPRRVEEVVPRRGLLPTDVRVQATGVRDETEDAGVPTGPEARRLLELGRHIFGVRRLVGLEEPLLAERVVELARTANEDVGLGVVLFGGDLRLEVAGGGEREHADLHAGCLGECREELVVRRLVERRVDRDPAGGLLASAAARGDDGGSRGKLEERASVELRCHVPLPMRVAPILRS